MQLEAICGCGHFGSWLSRAKVEFKCDELSRKRQPTWNEPKWPDAAASSTFNPKAHKNSRYLSLARSISVSRMCLTGAVTPRVILSSRDRFSVRCPRVIQLGM